MDARGKKRTIVSLPAEVFCRENHVAVTIENLSEDGVYIVTAPQRNAADFCPNTILEIRFTFPSGQKQILHCKIIWSYGTPPHGFTNSVGMEIIDPPPAFTEALKSLE